VTAITDLLAPVCEFSRQARLLETTEECVMLKVGEIRPVPEPGARGDAFRAPGSSAFAPSRYLLSAARATERPRCALRRPVALLLGVGWAMTALLEIAIFIMKNVRHPPFSGTPSVLNLVVAMAAGALAAYFFVLAARKAPLQ
jgi:hypothetical protein